LKVVFKCNIELNSYRVELHVKYKLEIKVHAFDCIYRSTKTYNLL